jgi:Hydrogenase formation hypA family
MNMKYVDEYRDPELAKRISGEIAKLSASRTLKFMEVCGGHTHTIYKHGIEDVLPPSIDLVHGYEALAKFWVLIHSPLRMRVNSWQSLLQRKQRAL